MGVQSAILPNRPAGGATQPVAPVTPSPSPPLVSPPPPVVIPPPVVPTPTPPPVTPTPPGNVTFYRGDATAFSPAVAGTGAGFSCAYPWLSQWQSVYFAAINIGMVSLCPWARQGMHD